MSNINFYIDGCSYTAGHSSEIIPWPTQFYKFELDNTNKARPQGALDLSQVAKSNEHIFFDFISNKDKLDSNTTVIIFWSHAERYMAYLDRTRPENELISIKNLNSSTIKDGYQYLLGNFTLKDSFLYQLYDMYLAKTLMFMYLVQEECKRRDIKYYFITVDPYYKYESVINYPAFPWATQIDKTKVFNWCMPEFEPLNTEPDLSFDRFISEWSITGFVTSWCRAFSRESGHNVFARDLKHMNQEGHIIFGTQLKRWMDDININMARIVDKELSYDAARHFKDMNYAAANLYPKEYIDSLKDKKERLHWVERTTLSYLQNAKLLADFVYEK